MIPINESELTVHELELLAIYHENLIEAGLVLAVVEYDQFKHAALYGFDPEQEEELDI
jgi:hypothetical protein